MEVEHEKITTQMMRIFDSFLDPNFTTANDVYFEKLITQLSSKEYEFMLRAPFLIQWVDKCLTLLTEDLGKLNAKVTSFMFNVFGLLTKNEWNIYEVRERHMVDRLRVIIEKNMDRFTASMKLGSIRVYAAISKYSLGSMYIRNSKAWKMFIEFCTRDHTLYVIREARQLIFELIYSFNTKVKDDQSVLEIFNDILKPILDNNYDENSERIMINVDDSDLQRTLTPSLELLSFILQKTLEVEEKCSIAQLLQKHYNFEVTIWKLTEMTQNQQFMEKILATLISFNFALLLCEQWTKGQIPSENFSKFGVVFFNILRFCISRAEFENFLKLVEFNHVLWKKLGKRAPIEIQMETQRIRFENQLIMLQLMPVLFILRSTEFHEEFFDSYLMRLFDISCEQTLRICYSFRDFFSPDTFDSVKQVSTLAYKAIHGILANEKILERDQAVLVFQAMVYTLKEFLHNTNQQICDANPKKVSNAKYYWTGSLLILEIPHVLSAVLIGLRKLIKRYEITWKDSIETICLVNIVAVIIEDSNLTSTLAVQALKLIQLAIEHFLSPNMALLVDNLEGSGLVCLGPIITRRFHDNMWEVRDTTLELVTCIASISKLKFPAFQSFLVNYKICPIVYEMSKNDSEPYVRASALRCLTKMIQLNCIWENDLSNLHIIEHLLHVLYKESEGIVRIEAICGICQIYDLRKVPNELLDTLFSTMAHCVIADLHWEVKLNALQFFRLEILKQFTNQGMIDGTFPTVTFSKENKKIVTLTEKEINLRIKKALDELSQRGCLGVILKCISEECDIEVIKIAVCMVYKLLEILRKYDYLSTLDSHNEKKTDSTQSAAISCDTSPSIQKSGIDFSHVVAVEDAKTRNSDAVIENILSSQDINLLQNAYEYQMTLNGLEPKQVLVDPDYYKIFASVDAKEFVATVDRMNLYELVQSHEDWLACNESFPSLLEDIMRGLKIDVDESIVSDCY